MLDSQPPVAWISHNCCVTVQRFFQKVSDLLETSNKSCLTVGQRSRDLRPLSRDRSVTLSKFFLVAWNVQIRCLTVGRRSRDLRPLSRDRSVTFYKNFPNCLKRPKTLLRQSADGRVTSDHCHVTIQWLITKNPNCLKRPKRCFTVGRRSRDLQPLSRDRSVTFFKMLPDCMKRPKTLFDRRPTVAWPLTTVAWPFSNFKKFLIAWIVEKSFFDSWPTVAWPSTTVAWPLSDFFPKIS